MKCRYLTLCALAAITFVAPTGVSAQTFGYFGDIGPAFWSALSPEWAACGTGEIQSPVDLAKAPQQPRWQKFEIAYDAVTTGEIFNNGHTIEVETEGANTLTLGGVDYGSCSSISTRRASTEWKGEGSTWSCTWFTARTTERMLLLACFCGAAARAGLLRPF